ncbi:MAG: DUF1015 domain-containing protein [Chloroflexi bacterium]|nr:DUF1015 domain-containing protein [Chloroflexota bacterium]
MAGIFPFRGVHYHDFAALQTLTAPPYDVISPADQQRLYDASPHNIVRLELGQKIGGESGSVYEQAASTLSEWMASGVLERDSQPAFYVYRQAYTLPDGSTHSRTGFFGEVALEEFSTGVILPHEETFAGPKEDRLRLLRACRANLSPIFGLYRDSPEVTHLLERAASGTPLADFADGAGIRNQLWRLSSPTECETITRNLDDRQILIADGHHRYETALAYRRERREQDAAHGDGWYGRALFVLVSMSDPGLVVLATHRILRRVDPAALENWIDRLQGSVEITCIDNDLDSVRRSLSDGAAGTSRFVLAVPGRLYLLTLGPVSGSALDQLDISRLHREVLPAVAGSADPHTLDIVYTQDPREALDAVDSGGAAAAFLVNAAAVERVDAVAASGSRMPEKSTYFYPKLSTGVVIRVEPRAETQ